MWSDEKQDRDSDTDIRGPIVSSDNGDESTDDDRKVLKLPPFKLRRGRSMRATPPASSSKTKSDTHSNEYRRRRDSSASDASLSVRSDSSADILPRNSWSRSSSPEHFPQVLGQVEGKSKVDRLDVDERGAHKWRILSFLVCLGRSNVLEAHLSFQDILNRSTSEKKSALLREMMLNEFEGNGGVYLVPFFVGVIEWDGKNRYSNEQLAIVADIIQFIIDSMEGPPEELASLTQSLYLLAKRTRIVPSSLKLTGIVRTSTHAIGGGGFSDVWRGTYKGEPVALKVIRSYGVSNTGLSQELSREAIVWRQLYHENILPFYGLCFEEFAPQIALVSPWADNHDLRSFLQNNEATDRIDMAYQIASGLRYLHSRSPVIVHGDLRPANIVIDAFRRPRITDFGLAKAIDLVGSISSHRGTCPLKWLAPELLNPKRFGINHPRLTTQSDIYAYGMTIYEVFTGHGPFRGVPEVMIAVAVGVNDERPERPEHHYDGFTDRAWELIQKCWAIDKDERPNVRRIQLILLILKPWSHLPSFLIKDETAKNGVGECKPLEGDVSLEPSSGPEFLSKVEPISKLPEARVPVDVVPDERLDSVPKE